MWEPVSHSCVGSRAAFVAFSKTHRAVDRPTKSRPFRFSKRVSGRGLHLGSQFLSGKTFPRRLLTPTYPKSQGSSVTAWMPPQCRPASYSARPPAAMRSTARKAPVWHPNHLAATRSYQGSTRPECPMPGTALGTAIWWPSRHRCRGHERRDKQYPLRTQGAIIEQPLGITSY